MAFPFSPKERDQKRAEMNVQLEEYARLHVQYILEKEVHRSTKKKILAPLLNTCTTGLGKSVAVLLIAKILSKYNLPLLVVTNNHVVAKEYVERIGAHEFFGKQMTVEQWSASGKIGAHPSPKSVCFKIEVVSEASKQGHRPSAEVCKNRCEFGKAGAIKFSQDPTAVSKAKAWMENNKFDIDRTPHCPYLYAGLPEARAAKVLVMTSQAFSDAFGDYEERNGAVVINKVPRLVVFDEKVELTRRAMILTSDVSNWIDELLKLKTSQVEKVGRLIKKADSKQKDLIDLLTEADLFTHDKSDYISTKKEIRRHLKEFIKSNEFSDMREADQDEMMESLKLLNVLRLVRQMFNRLINSITGNFPLREKQILTIYKLAQKCRAFTRGTARWESISFADGAYSIPLRALQMLAVNIQGKTFLKKDNELSVYEVTPPLEWALTRGSAIFLDATATPAMSAIIEKLGGTQFNSVLGQNIKVVRFVGKKYGKGRPEEVIQNAKKTYEQSKEIAALLKQKSGERECALLTHKSVFELSFSNPSDRSAAEKQAKAFLDETGVKAGWFNLHDRAHNAWQNHNLAIVGMEWLPKHVMEQEYHQARVALQYCGETWPEWAGEWEQDHLPRRKNERNVIIQRMAESIIQAIGRPRGLNWDGEPILVELWGGLQNEEMDDALRRYGIQISERIPNSLHYTLKQYNDSNKTDENAICEAINMLLAAGSAVSVRSVGQTLRSVGGTANDKVISAIINEMRTKGELPEVVRGRPKQVAA